jgi:hypothetical protein
VITLTVHAGMGEPTLAGIGQLPAATPSSGLLITDARPLRLADRAVRPVVDAGRVEGHRCGMAPAGPG